MGVRGEIFSTRLILPNRTYFLNVKENRLGDLYLNIVESKNKETGGFERQSVIVFSDDLPAFLGEFDKALKILEKTVREQKQGGGKRREERNASPDDYRPPRSSRGEGQRRNDNAQDKKRSPQNSRSERSARPERNNRTERSNRAERTDRSNNPERGSYSGGKRVVIKKRKP
jgi:hypothetical protein